MSLEEENPEPEKNSDKIINFEIEFSILERFFNDVYSEEKEKLIIEKLKSMDLSKKIKDIENKILNVYDKIYFLNETDFYILVSKITLNELKDLEKKIDFLYKILVTNNLDFPYRIKVVFELNKDKLEWIKENIIY